MTAAPIGGVWLATMETEHYQWRGAGHTVEEARDTLAAAWIRHVAELPPAVLADMREAPMTAERAMEYYGTRVQLIAPGEAFRDETRLVNADPPRQGDERERDPRCPACGGHGTDGGNEIRAALLFAIEALDYLATDNRERARKEAETDAESTALYKLGDDQQAAADVMRGWVRA